LSRTQRLTAQPAQISPQAGKPARSRGRRASAKPRPGRPTAARVEAINRAILVAARRLFVNAGYEATRMETIAAAAGVSKSTLYARYATKDALLWALIEHDAAFWSADELRNCAPLSSDLRQRLLFRARKIVEFYSSEKFAACEKLVNSAGHFAELRRMYFKMAHQQAIKDIAQDIVEGDREPIALQDALEVANILMGMLYGWASANTIVRRITREEALAYADRAVEVLFRGRLGWKK
jgi:TetR/AcrR family transcriptional regulator, mexJK operon transcriptional repressor